MRLLILIALSAGLSACNQGDSTQARSETERNVTNEVASTNDTTAIDAATGEAANMAADVEFTPENLDSADENQSGPSNAVDPGTNSNAD